MFDLKPGSSYTEDVTIGENVPALKGSKPISDSNKECRKQVKI